MTTPKNAPKRSHKKKVSTPMLPSQAPQLPVAYLPALPTLSRMPKVSKVEEKVSEPSIYSDLSFDSENYEKAAEKRWVWNKKIINEDALKQMLYSSVFNLSHEQNVYPPLIDAQHIANGIDLQDIEAHVDLRASEIMSAFELLPHSKRFLDLVFNIYSALEGETEGLGDAVVTNTTFLFDDIKAIPELMHPDATHIYSALKK